VDTNHTLFSSYRACEGSTLPNTFHFHRFKNLRARYLKFEERKNNDVILTTDHSDSDGSTEHTSHNHKRRRTENPVIIIFSPAKVASNFILTFMVIKSFISNT